MDEQKEYTVGELVEMIGRMNYSYDAALLRNYAQRKALAYSIVRAGGECLTVAFIFQGTKSLFGVLNSHKVTVEAAAAVIGRIEVEQKEVSDELKRKLLLRAI